MGYFLMQCETPESRFYKALRIVVRNPGISPEILRTEEVWEEAKA
jgi:hypothetical protein